MKLTPFMTNARELMAVVAAVTLTACTSSIGDLETSPDVFRLQADLDRNYQAAYRDLGATATDCLAAEMISASVVVDRDLYSELGFGEVTNWLSNFGARDFYWKAEVHETSSGTSRISVWFAPGPNTEKRARKIVEWAQGDRTCGFKSL